jgi:hypothetical protein
MSQPEDRNRTADLLEAQPPGKKHYEKPAVRHERIFETRALSCGKVVTTQQSCAHNRKNS